MDCPEGQRNQQKMVNDSPQNKKSDGREEVTSTADPELDALLDSALEDFDKPVPKIQTVNASGATNAVSSKPASQGTEKLGPELEELEKAMLSMLEDGPLKEHMKKYEEAMTAAAGGDTIPEDALSASIADALKGIAQSSQSLSENPSDEELAKVLQNLCFPGGAEGGGEGSLPDLIPLVQNVMQSLLSKDLLYPALKDIVDKYPDWLAEKRPSIEEKQFELYNRQYELMKQVCDEYNSESSTDSDETKKLRFDRISKLMQSIQECGNPPKELIGDGDGEFDADLFKNKLGEKECSIM